MVSQTFIASLILTTSALVLAQSSPATPAQSSAVASATGSSSSSSNNNLQDTENLVHYLLPSAPTSLSAPQASKVAVDASNYLAGFTASRPLQSIVGAGAAVGVLLDSTQPSGAQLTSIQDLLGQAGTAALANPSGYVQSVENLVQPFAFASAVTNYANNLFDGLRTVVGSDLSVAVPTPTPTSKSSSAGAARAGQAVPTGVIGVAAAAAVGAVGMMV